MAADFQGAKLGLSHHLTKSSYFHILEAAEPDETQGFCRSEVGYRY
jgi:hypothetical protein